MTTKEIQESLKKILVKELRLEDVTPEDIDDTAPLFSEEGLGLDSLDAVEIVVLVERHFGVVIADAEEARTIFTSVTALAGHIAKVQAAGKA